MIAALIDSAVIVESLGASSKDDVLTEMLDAAISGGRAAADDKKALRKLLADREALGSTGIGNGVAVPHVKSDRIGELGLILARSQDGIEYQAIDGRPVHTLFLLLAPKSAAEDHLAALRWVSTLARDADFRRFVMAAGDDDAIRDLLREMSQSA